MAPYKSGDLPSEALVTVVGGEENGREVFVREPPSWVSIRSARSLEEKLFEESDAIIIKDESYLSSNILQLNVVVPVIYVGMQVPAVERDSLVDKFNLYGVSDLLSMRETVLGALEAHRKVLRYLSESSGGREIIRSLDPPRFRNALKLAERYDDNQTSFQDMLRDHAHEYARIHFKGIVQEMAACALETDAGRKEKLGLELGKEIAQFLKHDRFLSQRDVSLVQTLGDGANGEGDVREVARSTEIALGEVQWVYKRVAPNKVLSAKEIAIQRASDSAWLIDNNTEFKTVRVIAPFAFEDYPSFERDDAFMVFEKVRNPQPFYGAVELLSEAYKKSQDKKLDVLRTRLVFKYIGDCTRWVQNPPPITSSLQKPKDKELIEEYRSQIEPAPALLSERSVAKFSELEKKVWYESTKVFRLVSTRKKYVVRVRDAGAGNLLISMNARNPSVDDYVSHFFDRDGKIDEEKIADSTYNIDTSYRYGHVFEDLANILTAYESRFLLYDSIENPKRTFANQARKRLFEIKNELAKRIGMSELESEDSSFVLMLLYRTTRKLQLFTQYWDSACRKYSDVEITKQEFEQRRERYTLNMMHHYNLGHVLCQESLRLINGKAAERVFRLPMSEQNAQQYLNAVRDGDSEDKNRVRLYALKSFFAKMSVDFMKARNSGEPCLV